MGIRRCEQCGKPLPEWSNVRMIYCPDCAYQRMKARNKDEREYLRQRGICTRCRKERAAEGRTMCPACLEQMRQYNRQRKKPLTSANANGSEKNTLGNYNK